jgi:hypothetical protein
VCNQPAARLLSGFGAYHLDHRIQRRRDCILRHDADLDAVTHGQGILGDEQDAAAAQILTHAPCDIAGASLAIGHVALQLDPGKISFFFTIQ